MVRFARIKGFHSKSSFNKVPEEASTWEALRATADTCDTLPCTEDVEAIKPLPKKVKGTWSVIEPETELGKKKKKKKRVEAEPENDYPMKKTYKTTNSEFWSDFEPQNGVTKKNNSKQRIESKAESEEHENKPENLEDVRSKKKKKVWSENEPESEEPKKNKSNNLSSGSWSEYEPEIKKAEKKKKSKMSDHDGSLFTTEHATHNQNIVRKSGKSYIAPVKKKTRIEKELEGLDFKRKKLADDELLLCMDGKEIKLDKFDGYLVAEERAKKLHELRQKLKEEGKNEKDIFGLIKSERRKAEKELKALKKRMCFHCRKGGHNLSDCPELGNKPDQGSGICFKCGSTEHKLSQCKSKSTTLEYATCFICNEKGHLSRNCSNNPRGLYPDGGGCKTCGDVTHYERDCPKKRKRTEAFLAKRIDSNDVEALDYDDEVVFRKKPLKIDVETRQNKIVKF